MRSDRLSTEMHIVPTGYTKWMFHRKTPLIVNGQPRPHEVATVCGQYESGIHICTGGDTDLFFVVFQPYAFKVLFGLPAHLFLSRNVDLDLVGIAGLKELKQRVLEADDNREAIRYVEDFLLLRLAHCADMDYFKRMKAVCSAIDHHPEANLTELSDQACLSERQFRRIFTEYAGLSPKQMLRIRRFYLATKLLQLPGEDPITQTWTRLGYTDHSHFNKECKHIIGLTPSDYLQHLNEIRREHFRRAYNGYHNGE